MATLFTKIYQGEIPGFLITETENIFVILDKYPVRPGHLLIIPKQEIPTVWEMDDQLYQEIMTLARQLSFPLQKVAHSDKVSMVVMGVHIQDHAHIHLIPFNQGDVPELSQGQEMSDSDLKKWQQKIKSALSS